MSVCQIYWLEQTDLTTKTQKYELEMEMKRYNQFEKKPSYGEEENIISF